MATAFRLGVAVGGDFLYDPAILHPKSTIAVI